MRRPAVEGVGARLLLVGVVRVHGAFKMQQLDHQLDLRVVGAAVPECVAQGVVHYDAAGDEVHVRLLKLIEHEASGYHQSPAATCEQP